MVPNYVESEGVPVNDLFCSLEKYSTNRVLPERHMTYAYSIRSCVSSNTTANSATVFGALYA